VRWVGGAACIGLGCLRALKGCKADTKCWACSACWALLRNRRLRPYDSRAVLCGWRLRPRDNPAGVASHDLARLAQPRYAMLRSAACCCAMPCCGMPCCAMPCCALCRRRLGLDDASPGQLPVAFCFGGGEGWDRLAVYFCTAAGQLYTLCPVLPFGAPGISREGGVALLALLAWVGSTWGRSSAACTSFAPPGDGCYPVLHLELWLDSIVSSDIERSSAFGVPCFQPWLAGVCTGAATRARSRVGLAQTPARITPYRKTPILP
jgi:hypothetical protein